MHNTEHTFRNIVYAVALFFLSFSCQKEIDDVEPAASVRRSIEITVNGLMGEYSQVDAAKSSLVNTVRVSWDNDDIVYVFDETECLGTLEASLDGTEDRYAILSGSIEAPSSGHTLYLVHSPLLDATPCITDGMISVSLAEQTNEKAPFVVYATLDYIEGQTTIEDLIVPFSFATSVIRVSCTGLKPNTAISCAYISGVNTNCVLSFSDGTVTVSGADTDMISRSDADGFANVNAEGDASFQFAVPALNSSSAGRTLTIMQGENEYLDVKFSKSAISPNHSVNTICTMVLKNNLIHGKFTVNDTGKKVYFSKGNLQATYNGSSYSWGFASNQYDIIGPGNTDIVNPVYGTKLDLFGWSTNATKYGISTSKDYNNYKGDFVDWGRALGSNVWRTLSIAEWEYLIGTRTVQDETGYGNTCVWATIEGTDGLIIFCDDYEGSTVDLNSIPENCVFLPAAGNRILNTDAEPVTQTKYDNKGYIIYWSATPNLPNLAYVLRLEHDDEYYSYQGSSSRNFGYPVRLVTECE